MAESSATAVKYQTAQVENLSHEGRGIAHQNGKAVFLLGALPNETVEFEYLKQHRRYSEGITKQIITAAAERVPAKCPHFLTCGGCSLQHLESSKQIEFKQKVLREQLQHIGNVQPEQWLAPLQGPVWGYRRKARLGVRYVNKKNKLLIGFREIDSRYLADIDSCAILDPRVGEKIPLLRTMIANLESQRDIAQMEVACSDDQVALIIRHLKPLPENDLKQLKNFAQLEHFYLYLQPSGPDSIHLLWPETNHASLKYQLPDYQLEYYFAPNDFTQVNSWINQQMVQRALELLAPTANEKILDLFCGLGNFSLPLAQRCQQVVGIEGDLRMVQKAQTNAAHNKLANTAFYAADLTKDCRYAAWAQSTYDKILLDPPRSGALEVMAYLPQFAANKILYISCNPATLARDSAELIKMGYRLTQAGVLDMFPHTSHVEAMALFVK